MHSTEMPTSIPFLYISLMEVVETQHLFLEYSLWNLNSESRLKAFEAHLFGTSKNAVRGIKYKRFGVEGAPF